MIPWAGDILTKPCRDRFFIQIYFYSLALNLTRGQATKYDRNKLHKVTFVAQNYIFVLFFSDGFSIGEVRWSLGNCVGDLPRWVFFATMSAGRLQNRSQWHRRNRQRRRYLLFVSKVFKKTYGICIDQMTKLWNSTFDKCKNRKQFVITICLRLQCTHFTFYVINIWKTLFYFVRIGGLGGQWMYFHLVIEKTMCAFFACSWTKWTSKNICYQMSRTCKNSPIWRICSAFSYMASKM